MIDVHALAREILDQPLDLPAEIDRRSNEIADRSDRVRRKLIRLKESGAPECMLAETGRLLRPDFESALAAENDADMLRRLMGELGPVARVSQLARLPRLATNVLEEEQVGACIRHVVRNITMSLRYDRLPDAPLTQAEQEEFDSVNQGVIEAVLQTLRGEE